MKNRYLKYIYIALLLLLAIIFFNYMENFENEYKDTSPEGNMISNSKYFRDDVGKTTKVNFDVLFLGADTLPALYAK